MRKGETMMDQGTQLRNDQTSGNMFECRDCGTIYNGYKGCHMCAESLTGKRTGPTWKRFDGQVTTLSHWEGQEMYWHVVVNG